MSGHERLIRSKWGTLFPGVDDWEFGGCKKSQVAPFKQKPLFFMKGQGTSFFGDFSAGL